MLPEFPKARRQMNEMWNQAFFAGFHGSDPFVAQIAIRVQKEGNTAFIGDGEMNYKKCSAQFSFPIRDAQGMSPDEFFGAAAKMGLDLGGQQAKGVFEAMSKPSPHAVPLNWSGPLTFQQVLDSWEQMDLDFGDDGLPIWPTVVLNAPAHAEFKEKLPKWLEDPECKQKWAELVARKRKAFDEREARRRLVD